MEDQEVLTQMRESLKPEGLMSLNVSQHAWLCSPGDEYACHVGRYATPDLHQKIDTAGFQVIKSNSFASTLPPTMVMSRFLQKKVSHKKFDSSAVLKISPWLNSLFIKLLRAELGFIRKNFSFPERGSRLFVARKI